MKKIGIMTLFIMLFGAFQVSADDEYAKCLEANYKTNEGLIKCADEENDRLFEELEQRYNIVANHKFFRPWNNQNHTFASLKAAWIKQRDEYCNLLGYSYTHGKDSFGDVAEARCKLKETQRFRQGIEELVKNYQKMLKRTKS